jgi:hypothetical protein
LEFFRLIPTNTTYENGEVINDIISKLWVERYRDAGIFKLVCSPTKKIMNELLPVGALISHADTRTVMIVENHEITTVKGQAPTLVVTGSSAETFLSQRVATDPYMGQYGAPWALGDAPLRLYDGSSWPYLFKDATAGEVITEAIRQQIQEGYVPAIRSELILPNVIVSNTLTDNGPLKDRDIKRGDLYATVLELLDEINGGIKVNRPNVSEPTIRIILHQGEDLVRDVRFSWAEGEIANAKYFKSSKRKKNAAYITNNFKGKYVERDTTLSGWDKRVMFIDATDITTNPNDPATIWIYQRLNAALDSQLDTRARRTIRRHKQKTILEATLSLSAKSHYRVDYDIGDIVWVDGDYDISDEMRVIEFAESEDENGEFGLPTLSAKEA